MFFTLLFKRKKEAFIRHCSLKVVLSLIKALYHAEYSFKFEFSKKWQFFNYFSSFFLFMVSLWLSDPACKVSRWKTLKLSLPLWPPKATAWKSSASLSRGFWCPSESSSYLKLIFGNLKETSGSANQSNPCAKDKTQRETQPIWVWE